MKARTVIKPEPVRRKIRTNKKEELNQVSKKILDANYSRNFVAIYNNHPSIKVYLGFGKDAVAEEGAVVKTGSPFIMNVRSGIISESIHAIADSNSPEIGVVEI